MSDSTRRKIIELLKEGPKCRLQIALHFGLYVLILNL
nr:ArsR family transcriptional regulator [Desulfosporosinus sp. Sb-LF]